MTSRNGSSMSTKQMARAAADERLITVWFSQEHVISGYLVGMDDFHWLIAHPLDTGKVATSLVHKSVDHIQISPTRTLTSADEPVAAEVRKIGSPFFKHCREKILAQHPSAASQEETTQQ